MASPLCVVGLALYLFLLGLVYSQPTVTVIEKDVEFLPEKIDVLGGQKFDLGEEVVSQVAYDPKTCTIMAVGEEFITMLRLGKDLTLTSIYREKINDLNFNSVRFCGGFFIVTAQDDDFEFNANGKLLIFKRFNLKVGFLQLVRSIPVGNRPIDVIVSKNCKRMLVTTRGEPFEANPLDVPVNEVGEVIQIDFKSSNLKSKFRMNRMDFCGFNGRVAELEMQSLFYVNKSYSLCADLEPARLCWNKDETRAFVTFTKNNAIGEISCMPKKRCEVVNLRGLGFKDNSIAGNGFDGNDEDGVINIQTWPTKSLYQPDHIECIECGGREFLITANEGRDNDIEMVDVSTLALDPVAFPNAGDLQGLDQLGHLEVFAGLGDMNGDEIYEMLYTAGARGCSMWDTNITQVFDSGDTFEQFVAMRRPEVFNSDTSESETVADSFDDESNELGVEAESLAILRVCEDYILKFTGAENPGFIFLSIMDCKNTAAGFQLIDLIDGLPDVIDTTKTWGELYEDRLVSLLEPEGLTIVEAKDSPTGKPLLIVGSENSSTVQVYQINVDCGDLPSGSNGSKKRKWKW